MPPPRFKAVCTETGREFGIDDLLCNGLMKDKCDLVIEPYAGLEYAIEFEGAHEAKNIELCQSTGLTDDAGKEIFYGDILCDMGDDVQSLWEVVSHRAQPYGFLFPDTTSKFELYGMLRERKSNPLYMLHGDMTFYVCGNRWQSAEERNARAEAVSNGQT